MACCTTQASLRAEIGRSEHAAEVPQLDLAVGADGEKLRAVVHYTGRHSAQLAALLQPASAAGGYDLLLKQLPHRAKPGVGGQRAAQGELVPVVGDGELSVIADGETESPPLVLVSSPVYCCCWGTQIQVRNRS